MSLFGNSILAGSAGQGGADLGDTIEQSLRFPAGSNAVLNSNSQFQATGGAFTLSFWVKFGAQELNTSNTLSFLGKMIQFQGNCQLIFGYDRRNGGAIFDNNGGTNNSPVFRDPSAWYHFLVTDDGTGNSENTYTVNGSVTWTPGASSRTASNQTFSIGYASGWGEFDGYFADVQFIDGSVQAATEFGRYNEDGVWVPKNYTGTYGTNGFHLTFDSSQTNGIGHDSSGNGNHFTANSFDEADAALYSAQTTATNGGFNASFPATNMFDGSLSTMALAASSNAVITFEPSTAIAFTNGVHMNVNHTAGDPGEFRVTIDGTTGSFTTFSTPVNSASSLVNQIATGSGNLEKIEVRRTGADNPAVVAIGINGTTTSNILVDNFDNDIDYNDTPTSNYATLNPLNYALATMSNANLAMRSSGSGAWQFRPASVGGQSTGKWYWEARAVGSGSSLMASIINDQYEKLNTSDVYPGQGAGVGTGGWSLYGANGRLYRNGVDQVASEGLAYGTDDILMFALDLENGAWWAGQNGTWYKSATTAEIEAGTTTNAIDTGTLSGEFWPGFVTQGSSANGWDVNFGQMPFIYTQPSGFNAWQTNNLPEPTIKDGKEHFEAIIWDGNDVDDRAITTTEEFAPDLVWIKCRDSAINHFIYDTVRGAPNRLFPNLTNAEDAGAGHLKSFTSNGFTLGTSGNVNGTGNEYVAWCWKAGGTAVSNSNGDITSSVSANTDAGFSIVRYTGNTGDDSVGHGLNQAPEVVFTKPLNASSWVCYFGTLGRNTWMNLNGSAAATGNITDYWGPSSSWTNTTMGVYSAGNGNNNLNGVDTIAYCWHSVEGYSKFGSYTGNGNADGPFIYTGFRPAFVMMKAAVGATGSWMILDSTRSPSNPSQAQLRADLTTGEVSNAAYDVDFLSNGFKPRYYYSNNNSSGVTYIYAAFAENPFGGENQPPATAR